MLSAEHSVICGLEAAVRSKKSIDFASANLEFDMIDHRPFAEPLSHPAHIEGKIAYSLKIGHRVVPNSTSTG
jgi:hypothetical protein